MKQALFLTLFISFLMSCSVKVEVDTIMHNGHIYTVDEIFTIAEAIAISGDSIVEVGPEHQILNKYRGKNTIDLQKKSVYPGLIDAHCHFLGFSKYNALLNLNGVTSLESLYKKLGEYISSTNSKWIVGRGWDQNLWNQKQYPENSLLNELYPDKYIILKRVDGHAAFVNQKVLDLASINETTQIEGGEIVVSEGICTGILVDNAVDLVTDLIPEPSFEEMKELVNKAEILCLEKGLTTLSDAGLDKSDVELLMRLKDEKELKLKIYAMLNPSEENFNTFLDNGPINYSNIHLNSFKIYADGALGSRGACLLQPYHDRDEHSGFLLNSHDTLQLFANKIYEAGFQMNTHAIGDSANRTMLKIYGEVLQSTNDRRWRIEHAQVVNPDDFNYFRNFNIIPSVQPTHATSDSPWAEERLGPNRVKHAYAYQSLKNQNGLVALGTDFPVESIDPLLTLLSAQFRVNSKGEPKGGFQTNERLSFEESIRGMTIWAAIANFEESEKGSLETGKKADLVVFNQDLKNLTFENYTDFQVITTMINGEIVYSR